MLFLRADLRLFDDEVKARPEGRANGGFLSSGNRVGNAMNQMIIGNSGHWVMDDVTYTTGITWPPAAVPEPATWAMLICGFAFVGASMRQRRFALVVPQR